MKLINCLRLTIDMAIKKKKSLLLVMILSFGAAYLIDTSCFLTAKDDYYRIKIKDMINTDDLYCLSWKGYNTEFNSGSTDFYEMSESLTEIDGIEGSGSWTTLGSIFQLSAGIQNLCTLKTTDGETVDLNQQVDGLYVAYVGYDLKDDYPVGSTYTFNLPGSEYQVYIAGVLEEGTEWLPAQISANDEYSQSLDKYIVTYATGFVDVGDEVWFYTDGSEPDTDAIYAMAEEKDINVKVYSLDEYCKLYVSNDSQSTTDMYNFFIGYILIFVVVIAASVSSVAVMLNKADYGIMLSNGMTRKDIYRMICFNNLGAVFIPTLLAFLIRIPVISQTDFGIEDANVYGVLLRLHVTSVLPMLLLIMALVFVLSVVFPLGIFSRYNTVQLITKED